MKVSKQTLDILNSFSSINNGMMINEGERLRVRDNSGKIIAYANINDSFPKDFAIYDLGEFLSAIGLIDDPTFDFFDANLIIKNGKGRAIRYNYGDSEYITKAPEVVKYPNDDPDNVSFDLEASRMTSVIKACDTLGLDYVTVSTKSGSTDVVIASSDPENAEDSNQYTDIVGETSPDTEYTFVFAVDRMKKIVPADYQVSINPKGISRFSGTTLEYYVVIEATSEFTKA